VKVLHLLLNVPSRPLYLVTEFLTETLVWANQNALFIFSIFSRLAFIAVLLPG
jgi:hypothetical protein